MLKSAGTSQSLPAGIPLVPNLLHDKNSRHGKTRQDASSAKSAKARSARRMTRMCESSSGNAIRTVPQTSATKCAGQRGQHGSESCGFRPDEPGRYELPPTGWLQTGWRRWSVRDFRSVASRLGMASGRVKRRALTHWRCPSGLCGYCRHSAKGVRRL